MATSNTKLTYQKGEEERLVSRMRTVYPYVVRKLRMGVSDDERAAVEREKMQIKEGYEAKYHAWLTHKEVPSDDADFIKWTTQPRWPYFFAHAAASDCNGEFVLPLQHRFLLAWAPNIQPLLAVWMNTCRVVFDLGDHRVDDYYIEKWSDWMFAHIRDALLQHPKVDQLTDLVSLLPIVECELADAKKQKDASAAFAQKDLHGDIAGYHPVTYWDFYKRLFMPGPSRLGVPLPVGLVLFEGRATTPPSASDILRDRVRRAPFSTSWHPNVALLYTSTLVGTLLVHKIMSDTILGVDVQQARSTHTVHRSHRLGTWPECEIIVQPLVSFHLVQDADVLLDQWQGVQWTHVVFTHAFLGEVCPCEAQRETNATVADHPSSTGTQT